MQNQGEKGKLAVPQSGKENNVSQHLLDQSPNLNQLNRQKLGKVQNMIRCCLLILTDQKSFNLQGLQVEMITRQSLKVLSESILKATFTILRKRIVPIIKVLHRFVKNRNQWKMCYCKREVTQLVFKISQKVSQFTRKNMMFSHWVAFQEKFQMVTCLKLKANKDKQLTQNEEDALLLHYENKTIDNFDPITMTSQGPMLTSKHVSQVVENTEGAYQLLSSLKRCRVQEMSEQEKKFIENIHNEDNLPKDQLCCARFFYQGLSVWNPYLDNQVSVQYIENSQRINEDELKQKVVAMLNSKGGVLLFDVFPNLMDLICSGVGINEKGKQMIEQKITSFLDNVSPKLTVNQNYSFNWVPVKKNPLKYQRNDNKSFEYRKGCFVLMMKIKNVNPQETYHYTSRKKSYFYQIRENKVQHVQQHQVDKLIRKRYRTFFRQTKVRLHHHAFAPIQFPDEGERVYSEGGVDPPSTPSEPLKKFKFQSLLICDQTNLHKVEQGLKKQKIEHQIEATFLHMKFKLSQTTWILHHDVRFDRVKVCLNTQGIRYMNNSKPVMLISTTNSLKTNYIDSGGLDSLNQWVKGAFPDENIEGQEYQGHTYLFTSTKICFIFLYLHLNNLNTEQKRATFFDIDERMDLIAVPVESIPD